MNLQETESVFALMRQFGVLHFKNLEMEIKMEALAAPISELPQAPRPESKGPAHAAAAPPVEMTIPHHINEVSSLLKLSDEQLVDKLFPDYTQPLGGE